MKVEQHDKKTGMVKTSQLEMVDLAGSEMASNQSASAAQRDASAVQMEAKMINKSLAALQNCIRAQLENQQGADHSIAAMSKQSKLTRFLRPSFGGNCKTWIILTASPSSYNIGETISTIKFGQRVSRIQNPAVVNADYSREVYRTRLRESEQQRKGQMAILKAVAQECKNLKSEALEGSFHEDEHDGPIWDTIEELLAAGDDAEELDFNTLIRGRIIVSDDKSVGSDETGDELEKTRRETQQLREQLESISKARDDTDNQLAELQSEVAVLRSQNEHLIADKTKDLEELINAKNELQIMSQRKIEVEHNFRTSQFRENEAIVFLRTFRRFYRNVLRDRAAQGSGSIKAITKEISDKVPGALDLSELVDADALLLEAGLIEEHEMRDEKSAPVYVPSKAALIRSATAAKKAANEMGALEKKLDSEAAKARGAPGEEDSAQSVPERAIPSRNSFRRGGSAIRRSSFASLEQTITEGEAVTTGDVIEEASEESGAEDATKDPGAGADAGAGSSQPADGHGSGSAEAALLWDQSGMSITRRQQLLGTPSGRFAIMQEKNIERELEDMADRCIKLEQALNEERATVDMLSGRAGGLNKKKLAQEAIQLRQQIEKKTQNLMAIAWKMNELNLINKSYNEKMVNREQHVVYLEENYVQLQNRNRMIIEEQQEAERKLRDELNSVKKVLGGMSVPLWQYNEEKLNEERSFASRIFIPVHGGSQSFQLDGEPPERRLSDAESEPSLDFQKEEDHPAVEKVDSSTQTDEVEVEDAEVQTEEVVDKEEIGVQTDEVLLEDIGTMTDESLGTVVLANSSSESVKGDASKMDDQEAVAESSAPAKLAAVGVLGVAGGAATAAALTSQTGEESVSDDKTDDTTIRELAPIGAGGAAACTATVVAIPTQAAYSSSEESESEDETDFAEKRAASSDFNAAVSSPAHDESSKESYETDSEDDGDVDAAAVARDANICQSEESESDEHEEKRGARTGTDAPSAATTLSVEDDDHRSEDLESDDDIEALTGELAADGVVPQSIAVDSGRANDDDEIVGTDVVDKPHWTGAKLAAGGVSGAAVVAAAALVAREEGRSRSEEPRQLVGDNDKSKEVEDNGKGDTFKAKNIFAATVLSVLNIGGNDGAAKQEAATPGETEIELYHGDGHFPHRRDGAEDYTASSRDEWAAARDDFDSIFNETAQAVNTSSSRRRPMKEEDREKSNREFMDIAAKIGHKSEEEIVTMGSKRQLWSHEGRTVEEMRKPWEKGGSGDGRKPWDKSSKRGKDDGSLGSSYDITKDDWYGGSDEESDGSYKFETHVLKRPQKEEASQEDTQIKFSRSTTKRETSASEDEFDQMMNATQAALETAEELLSDAEDDVPTHDATSLTSKEDALFTGGRPSGFQPRRMVEKPKIRAGVVKEEKKPSRDRSRSQLDRRKSESRRKLGDDKKRKKKEEKKKKKSSRSSRSLARVKSERHTHHKRDKEDKGHSLSPRRKSEG